MSSSVPPIGSGSGSWGTGRSSSFGRSRSVCSSLQGCSPGWFESWLFLHERRTFVCEGTWSGSVFQAVPPGFSGSPQAGKVVGLHGQLVEVPAASFSNLRRSRLEIDTGAARAAPKLARLTKFRELLRSLSAARQASARRLASLLGMMESFHGLLPLARTHERPLRRVLLSLWTPAVQVDPPFPPRSLVPSGGEEVVRRAWLSQDMPLVLPPVSSEIVTVSSLQGWGTHLCSKCVRGFGPETNLSSTLASRRLSQSSSLFMRWLRTFGVR